MPFSPHHRCALSARVLCRVVLTKNCAAPCTNTLRVLDRRRPLSKPCTTLGDAIAWLAMGAPDAARHPDIRVRPTGAALPPKALGFARKASVYGGFDDSSV